MGQVSMESASLALSSISPKATDQKYRDQFFFSIIGTDYLDWYLNV